MKWKGVYEALMMEIPATETPQAAKIRMGTYGVFSLTAYSHLVDACTGCAVALGMLWFMQQQINSNGQTIY